MFSSLFPKEWNCSTIWYDKSHWCNDLDFYLTLGSFILLIVIFGGIIEAFKGRNMASIKFTVNGVTTEYVGDNIDIAGGKIFINGKEQDIANGKQVIVEKIEVNGDLEYIKTSNSDITVNGNVKQNIQTSNGDVDCHDVGGNVSTSNGDIYCQNVSGNVSSNIGNISHKK